MRRVLAGILIALTAASVAACRSDPPSNALAATATARSCTVSVWYRPADSAAHVEVVASFAEWKRPGVTLPVAPAPAGADGWRAASFELPPGEHAYALVVDGEWLPDANVATTTFHEGREVTFVEVPRCDVPALRVDAVRATAGGSATLDATFLAAAGRTGAPIDPSTFSVTDRTGRNLPVERASIDPARGAVAITLDGLAPGKHALTLNARDTQGRAAEPAIATAWVERSPFTLADAVLYQVMVDRFRGDAGPLANPDVPSGRAGGTVRGVIRAIEAGEIQALGANVLWISPLYKNPEGTFPGNDGRPYSSYHGYWPIDSRATDPRFGPEADVDELLAVAHARGLRVIFDVVPNHVHEQHAYWTGAGATADARARAGKFNVATPTCVCGQGACDWARHIDDCWFAPYMPDLDWRNADVARQATSDVAWWLDRFDGDGVRIDAVPMMPRAATRRIVAALRGKYEHAGNPLLLLGENFTGPGGYDLLRYHLGPFGLSSQFHFPLMWSLRAAIASGAAPMKEIAAAIAGGEAAWRGSGAVMATMIGNHDVTRFASESAGQGGGDGWEPAPQPDDARVYAKQRLALGLVFTLPGAPVIYYGDEVGLAGRTDPDSRRVMPAEEALSGEQRATRAFTRQLGAARACAPALRRGAFRLLFADDEVVAFAREGDAMETAVVIAARNPTSAISAAFPGVTPGDFVDVLSGARTTLTSELTKLVIAPFSLRLYLPVTSACALTAP